MMRARVVAVLPLVVACLAPPINGSAPQTAEQRPGVPGLLDAAESAARACDLGRAQAQYDQARAACSACPPSEQVELELARVELALLAGQARRSTLEEGARVAERLADTDRLAAARLLAGLGRWQAPELTERAAQALELLPISPRGHAQTALRILLADPQFVTHSELGRSWPARYELSSYQWQAPGSSFARDDRYDAATCSTASARTGRIPGAAAQIFGQRVIYQKCQAQALQQALPGQRGMGSAAARLMVDPRGAVSRIDVYGAFLPETLVQCLGDTLRNLDWGVAPHGGIEELSFFFFTD